MYTGFYHTHKLVVILFLLIYVIKAILLVTNKKEQLEKFTKIVKVPEMIISFLFLVTGVYLLVNAAEVSFFIILKLVFVFASIPLAVIGFKKSKKPLAIIAVLFIILAYGMAEMNKGRKGKRVEIASNVETDAAASGYNSESHGKALYTSQCILCHGEGGDKGLSGAKNLQTSQLEEEEVNHIIAKGKNTMPAYEKSYSKEEIKALSAYVMTLRKQGDN